MQNKGSKLDHKQRRYLAPLFVLLLILLPPSAFAANLLVLSRESDTYKQVAASINASLQTPATTITLKELADNNYVTTNFNQIIAIGSAATDKLFAKIPADQKLIASFLPRQTYQNILNKYAGHTRISQKTITAVYLDQPYRRQFKLARLITPHANTIATALGPNSKEEIKALKSAAQAQNFELKYQILLESDNPINKLQPLIRNSDLFLSLPDKSVFNRTTAKWVLYISFRQRIPLIGFSQKYVQAGALTAVYSTPKQIGRQTAELINAYSNKTNLPKAQDPEYFSVAVNRKAAGSLGIKTPSEDALLQLLLEQE